MVSPTPLAKNSLLPSSLRSEIPPHSNTKAESIERGPAPSRPQRTATVGCVIYWLEPPSVRHREGTSDKAHKPAKYTIQFSFSHTLFSTAESSQISLSPFYYMYYQFVLITMVYN